MNMPLVRPTLREDAPRSLQELLSDDDHMADFDSVSEVAACLRPLLEALEWRGDARDLVEALPHHADDLTMVGLRNTMAHLGFTSRPVRTTLRRLDPRLLPCLFVSDRDELLIVLRPIDGGFLVFDPATQTSREEAKRNIRGTAYVFRPVAQESEDDTGDSPRPWIWKIIGRFRPDIKYLLGISFATNLLALTVPLFILALYDRVIPTGSTSTLGMLAAGAALVLTFDLGFRYLRSNILGMVGGRFDILVGSAIFGRLLGLAPLQTEMAPLGAQIARIRELHAVRSVFVGPLCVAVFDLPFVLLFLGVVALLGGWLVLVPGLAILFYVLIALITHRQLAGQLDISARAGTDHQSFLVETATKARAIKYHGLQGIWTERHRDVSARSALAVQKLARLAGVVEVLAETLKLAAGVGTLVFGILLVLDATMSVGALIASMALVWRALSPIQVLFLSATRIEQVRKSIGSINALMAITPESKSEEVSHSRKRYAGRITCNGIGFQYLRDRDPAIRGINLDIRPGEFVAVTGPSGAGKSTLLKLMLGMYQPQSGSVMIDGIDIRQLDRVRLRQGIAYLPQTAQFFHGTVAQNLRLADPTASDGRLFHAALEAGILSEILSLPDGFDSWLDSDRLKNMPQGIRQRLNLARSYVSKAPILLLDEPENGLDRAGNEYLVEALRERSGDSTIVLVTHRPSHMELADRVLLMERGIIRLEGPPALVMSQISGDKK